MFFRALVLGLGFSMLGLFSAPAQANKYVCNVKYIRDSHMTLLMNTESKNPRVVKKPVERGHTVEVYTRPKNVKHGPPYVYLANAATPVEVPGEDIRSIDEGCTLYRNQ